MGTIGGGVGIDMEGTSPFQAPQTHEKAHSGSFTRFIIIQQRCAGGSGEEAEKRVKKPDLNERERPLAVSWFDSVVRGHSD